MLINAWEPHAYAHDPRRPRTVILALYIEPVWLGGFRRNWTASGTPGFFDRCCVALPHAVRLLADELAEAMVEGADAAQEHLLSELMIAVIERFAPWSAAAAPLRDRARAASVDHRIRRSLALIRENPGGIGDVSGLAQKAGLSRAHFFRLFEQSVHVPPRVFLNVMRLERAVGELVGGRATVAEISGWLGFSAPPHFTRFFRDHAGASPSEFRAVAHRHADFETAG